MKKGKLLGSVNQINRKKRYEDYFDPQKTYLMTPHSRSLPKKKPFFGNKKDKKKNTTKRKNSIIMRKENKYSRSPNSKQKNSKHDYSNHRDYDSPSRDNQQLDLILAEKPKNKKNGCLAQVTIDKVYQKLKRNKLQDSISILQQALNSQPNNYDMNYLLGVCLLISGSYQQAINLFDSLLQKKTRKNIFLLLSVCYKKIEDFRQTETILNICLKKYPKYYQAYIYRGKLSLKLKRYREAMVDFQKAISLHPEKHIAYIGRGDCLRLSEKYEQAKTVYTKALNLNKKNNISILLRRAICSIQLKRFDPAFNDIEELLNHDPQNSQALYFKGLIFNKQKMQNEAIICYQQAIKFNTNKKAVTRSIYEIAKIKIQHRDYYEALYTLERAQHLDIEQKVIRKFKLFTDGVTQMMKKNYQQGIRILSQLLNQDDKPLNNFLKPLIYSSRSYGYMSLSKFQQATEDLQLMQSQYPLDLPNLYNKFICEGITACNSQKYQQALSYFSKAGKTMPSRIQPNFYKAVTLICFASKLIPKQMKQKRSQYIHSAIKTVLKVQKHIQNNPSLFLVRGFLYYAIGDLQKSLDDLDKCMSQSIKHHSLNFYLNGLILGQLGKNQEAIDQFKKALNADLGQKIPQIYLNKAKSLLLTGQINGGFVDLQTYMSFRPSSPDIHIWAGHLLSYIGATEDAAKAYSNINNINQNFEVLFYRAKCFMNSKDVISTISNLKQMLQVKYQNKTFFDYQMLQLLRQCSEQGQVDYKRVLNDMKQSKQKAQKTGQQKFGNLFKQSQYQFYKGVMYFYIKDYQKAAKNFERSLKIKQNFLHDIDENSQQSLQFYKLSYNNLCYNYYQGIYNCAMAEIMGGNIMKGLKRMKYINQRIGQGQTKNQLQLLAHTLQKQIKSQFDKKQQQQQVQDAQLLPFIFQNRLCSIFPQFILPLSTPIRTKLFFCLPSVQKPQIKPCFNDKLFDQITMKIIQIKPQAPWIKRSQQGVIFTDDVLGCDVQLSASSSSQEEQEEQEYQVQQNQYDDNSFENEGNASQGNQAPSLMNPSQLKQFFKLDRNIEQKLARLK